jgi:hypothetical protein
LRVRAQEGQQRIVERLRVRNIHSVRSTAHSHQLAVRYGAVGTLPRPFNLFPAVASA